MPERLSHDELQSLVATLQRDMAKLELRCDILLAQETREKFGIHIYAAFINVFGNRPQCDFAALRKQALEQTDLFIKDLGGL